MAKIESNTKKMIIFLILLFISVSVYSQENYIVKKTDTMWDLSGTYLGDPFVWGKIWEANMQVVDPNKIYPGDKLVIPGLDSDNYSKNTGGSTNNNTNNRVTKSSNADAQDQTTGDNSRPRSNSELKFMRDPLPKGLVTDESSNNSRKPRYWGEDEFDGSFSSSLPLRQVTFIWDTPNANGFVIPGNASIDDEGKVGSFREFDEVKCSIEMNAKYMLGDSVEIFNVIKREKYREKNISLVKMVALATVTSVNETSNFMSIKIIKMWDSVNDGFRVGKLEQLPVFTMKIGNLSKPQKEIKGAVIFKTKSSDISYLYQPIIINIGKIHGLSIGDICHIYTEKEGEVSKDPSVTGFIIHLGDEISTLLISSISNNIDIGDPVELFRHVTFKEKE